MILRGALPDGTTSETLADVGLSNARIDGSESPRRFQTTTIHRGYESLSSNNSNSPNSSMRPQILRNRIACQFLNPIQGQMTNQALLMKPEFRFDQSSEVVQN